MKREPGDNRTNWYDYGDCSQAWRDRHKITKEEDLGWVMWVLPDGHRAFNTKPGLIAKMYRVAWRWFQK